MTHQHLTFWMIPLLWVALPVPVVAQLIPDDTLGDESSIVTPDVPVRGAPADLIEGGAARGDNLFHSFSEFNIGELQRLYFANPAGIENILGRVTGSNASDILGTLGVDGGANLYLINPNGIVFGPNAQLDISGSFFASTADAFDLGNGDLYSAVNPNLPPLLSVSIAPGLQFSATQRAIANDANLTVGQDLTLAGGNLDLTGQLIAGGNLTLEAQDTVTIRDDVAQTFIAAAGGELTLQGIQAVDIFALNHPDSGLFSGGDMVLRSPTPVIGDAHYFAGGNFSIQDLEANPGELSSPHDPIVIANGDVIIGDYTLGASLHILAGGAVGLGNITINQVDTTAATISPSNPVPILAELATVELGDGTTLVIDGANQPTLDVRAGIDWDAFGGLPGNQVVPPNALVADFQDPPTSTGIIVGNIDANIDNSLVFLTNRFNRNVDLVQAPILVADIATNIDNGQAGSVIVDAFGDILTAEIGTFINVGGVGDAGDITLLSEAGGIDTTTGSLVTSTPNGTSGRVRLAAEGNITTANIDSFVTAGGMGQTEAIAITSRSGSIDTTAGTISTAVEQGTAGPIFLSAAGDITAGNIDSFVNSGGDAGDIGIISGGNFLLANRTINSVTFGEGTGGTIAIQANAVTLEDLAFIQANSFGSGDSGAVGIFTPNLLIREGSEVLSQAFGAGDAQGIVVGPLDPNQPSQVIIDGVAPLVFAPDGTYVNGGFSSGLFSTTEDGATGQGGIVSVTTDTLTLSNGGAISARTRSSADSSGILINVDDLFLTGGGQILATSFAEGNAGTLLVNANNSVNISGEDLNYNARFNDLFESAFNTFILSGQSIQEAAINAQNFAQEIIDPVASTSGLEASNFPDFFPDTLTFNPNGPGGTGNIVVTSPNILMSDQGLMEVSTFGINEGGNILLFSQNLELTGGAGIVAATFGNGRGGNIEISPLQDGGPSTVVIDGIVPYVGIDPELNAPDGGFPSGIFASTELRPSLVSGIDPVVSSGAGGDITLIADTVTISNGGNINTRTRSAGNGGNVFVDVRDLNVLDGGQILAPTLGNGDAGDIEIVASGDIVIDGFDPDWNSRLTTIQDDLVNIAGFTESEAFALTRFTLGSVSPNSALVSDAQFEANANGGDIRIRNAQSLSLSNFGLIGVSTNGTGNAGSFFADIENAITLSGSSNIRALVEAGAVGNGGDIILNSRTLSLTEGSQISASVFREIDLNGDGIIDLPGGIAPEEAGDIRIFASEAVTISGLGPDLLGNGPFSSGLLVSTEAGAQGNAGGIFVETGELSLIDGGIIIARTDNSSNAGDIMLTVDDTLALIREDLNAEDVAWGGLISVDGPIGENGEILIDNPGSPGNINIDAATVELVEGGKIRAVTASGSNGNINITAQNYVNMVGIQTSIDPSESCPTCSEISTEAFGSTAQGGNITIRVGSGVFARLDENSDIVANAVGSNLAANITIESLGDGDGFVGAFTFNNQQGRTLESDFDASSELTTAEGTTAVAETEITQTEVLPTVLDSSTLIDRRCELIASGNRSEFSIRGRGGLPTDPRDRLNEDTLLEDLGPETTNTDDSQSLEPEDEELLAEQPPAIIQEPQDWVQAEDGSIYLFAEADTPHSAPYPIAQTCEPEHEPRSD
ncbi:MAG: filamentous hemagglutinin N-terminal domain-containing protein [Cyanobacteria bacterium J06639_14]